MISSMWSAVSFRTDTALADSTLAALRRFSARLEMHLWSLFAEAEKLLIKCYRPQKQERAYWPFLVSGGERDALRHF